MSLFLLVGYILLFGYWTYWVLKKCTALATLTNYLNVVGMILIIFPMIDMMTYSRHVTTLEPTAADFQKQIWQRSGVTDIQARKIQNPQAQPDIYYIILDSYTRADVLQGLFGYDNSDFIQALEKRGFYVAKQSRSNYTDTVFSMSSSLNMSHVNTIPEFLRPNMGGADKETLQDMLSFLVKQNRVRSFLLQQGYSFVSFDNSFERINIKSADFYEKSPVIGMFNPWAAFDLILLHSTLGKVYFDWRGEENGPLQSVFDDHRARILFTLDNLDKYADQKGSYFIYAHIISPHSPYIFGPNGEERRGADPFTLLDNFNDDWSPDLYRDQVIYINKKVIETIDRILIKSDLKPIIIIQADHGNRTYDVINPSTDMQMKLLFPILNAYFLPGFENNSPMYSAITPVNSFRLVFNTYFGTQLDLLNDTSYILEKKQGRLEFVDACAAYQACAP